jgi:polyhydroxyalkanoate synthesis regulator phasin
VRKKLIVGVTAGVLTVSGLAVAVPALADDGTGTTGIERIRDALSGLVDDGSLTQDQADEVAETLDEAGIGGHGGRPGWGPGAGLTAAADALGMTEEELRTALQEDGATLAQVAGDQGVAVDDLVAALVQAAQERIAEAVEEGRLSQEEADELLADLEDRITDRVDEELPARGPGGGWGPGSRGADPDEAAPED